MTRLIEKTQEMAKTLGDRMGASLRVVTREYQLPGHAGTCLPVKGARNLFLGIWQDNQTHRFSTPVFPQFFPSESRWFMLYPFNWANYQTLSEHLPRLNPRPAGVVPSFGCGDRLGMVSSAHLEGLIPYPVFPVLAQQSPRELENTHRTFSEVLLGAAWGILESGKEIPYGADADHIREPASLLAAIDAGFTMYTLDVSGETRPEIEQMRADQLEHAYQGLSADQAELYRRYQDRECRLGNGVKVSFPEQVLLPLVLMYAPALDFVERMNAMIAGKLAGGYDLEISLDEGEAVSSPEVHFLFAEELHRRGVDFQSLALRFPGSFEKGIDYRGMTEEFTASATTHSTMAREIGGYRLSLHSGSDKFNIYPAWREATNGLCHVKTSGTSWLKALEAIALRSPAFFREIYTLGVQTLPDNRKAYQISTREGEVSESLDRRPDHRLPELFSQPAVRQVLHIAYGSILDRFGDRVRAVLFEQEPVHYRLVGDHLAAHLALLTERG